MSSLSLNSGLSIPKIGFGTWQIEDEVACKTAVRSALDAGYRHIDTAQIYGNEQFVGTAVKESGIKREDLFITTKIWTGNMFAGRVVPSFDTSPNKLQTDYVDLLLLHFPVSVIRNKAWQKLEQIHESGRAKSIGVSNFTIRHLEKLLKNAKVTPAVNQVELHVFLQQPELLDYCADHGIVVEAYSPLAHA